MAGDEKHGSHAATPNSVSAEDSHGKRKRKRSNSPLDQNKRKAHSLSPSSVVLRSRSRSVQSIVSSKDQFRSHSRSYRWSTRGYRSRSRRRHSHSRRHSYSRRRSSDRGYRRRDRDQSYYYDDYDRYSHSRRSRDRESSYFHHQRSRDRDYRPSRYDYREYEDERFFRDNRSYYHGDPHHRPDDFGEDYSVRFTPDGDDYLRSHSRSRSPSANGPTKDTVSDEKPKEPADSGSGDQSTAKQPKGNLKKLIDNYSSCKKSAEDPVTRPILENLVPVLESWWWEPFSKEDAKEIYAQCERPANVGPLRKVWINEEVYKKMGADGREVDQTLCYINNSFTRGCQPLASCWGKLVRAEMVIKDYNEANDKGNAVLGLPDATALNLTSLRTLLDLALQVLGMTNYQIVTSRWAVLKKYLNKDYHELCDKGHPIDYRMFGPNFKAQVEELNKFNKLASQVVTSAKSSAAKKKSPASQQY